MKLMQPILSICIPTFNRSNSLDNLLKNLHEITPKYGSIIEICISNNCSTDNTDYIINKWSNDLNLVIARNSSNIGGTKNFIHVSNMSSGKWILLCGDDDEFDAINFDNLISSIKNSNTTDWILAGVSINSNNDNLLATLKSGRYDTKMFKKIALKTGLYRYGFIGMHIFPSSIKHVFNNLNYNNYVINNKMPWPHLYLFLYYYLSFPVNIKIINESIIKQSPNSTNNQWKIGDWYCINLYKLNTISLVQQEINKSKLYLLSQFLRELYSYKNFKDLVLWRIVDTADFKNKIINELISRYRLLGVYSFLVTFHLFLVFILLIIPSIFFKTPFIKNKIKRHNEKFKNSHAIDPIKRGI